jgi:hypothetical protein
LRAGANSSNVDNNSASSGGADHVTPTQPSLDTPSGGREKPGEPQVRDPIPPAAPPARPVSDVPGIELPALPAAPPLPPERDESHRDLQRGDTKMPQIKTLGIPLALAAALSGQPLAAGDVEKPPTAEQTAKDVKELKEAHKKSSDALMEQLKRMEEQLKAMDGIRKDVEALQSKVRSLDVTVDLLAQTNKRSTQDVADLQAQLRQATARLGKAEQELTDQKARCDGLNGEIAALRKQTAESSRQAARLTEGTGTIRLFNTYTLPVSVILNGRTIRLDPGETFTLSSQPLGTFNYEVPGIRSLRTETLTADRPFEIEVFDQLRGPIKTPRR